MNGGNRDSMIVHCSGNGNLNINLAEYSVKNNRINLNNAHISAIN
jgi:hypothetical protein